ncbi:MAG: type II toxin-antitoxin system RelE/ParE family toxin [Chloroflexi bacterium]|nr:MAG: type II toxin-antitoxin system RelE/ParE family toxin [Chloroflexota bacterium]
MFRIRYTTHAQRELGRLPPKTATRIDIKIGRLGQQPRPPGCRKLAFSENVYRIRLGGYRVIYEIRDEELLILVIRIAKRDKQTYRRL